MENKFVNYYSKVQEDANDLADQLYDELIEELTQASQGLRLETFLSWKDTEINEFNNYMSISLREAVEIIEQSTRLIDDSAMYVNAGDCRDQVKSMAYWTYRNDLHAEFIVALKSKLAADLEIFENNLNTLEKQKENLEELIEEKESIILDVELELNTTQDSKKEKLLQLKLERLQKELDDINTQYYKIEEEIEVPQNLTINIEAILGEK